jgi:hypothetical protein
VPQARRSCLFRLRLFVWKSSSVHEALANGPKPVGFRRHHWLLSCISPMRFGWTTGMFPPFRLCNHRFLQRIIGAVPNEDQEHAARQVWSHHTPGSSSIGNVPSQIFVQDDPGSHIRAVPYSRFASKVGFRRVTFNCLKLKCYLLLRVTKVNSILESGTASEIGRR